MARQKKATKPQAKKSLSRKKMRDVKGGIYDEPHDEL